jgi:hypothetical protein
VLGPRRFLVMLAVLLLVTGGAVPPAVAASGASVPPGHLPRSAARLVGIGPHGAMYVLPDGHRMALGRAGATLRPKPGAGAMLLVGGWVRAHGKKFGFSLESLSPAGGGPQDGVFFSGLGIGHGDFSHDRFGLQFHSYELDSLGTPWVTVRNDASRGRMTTGSALGRWGGLHLTLTAKGAPIVRCGGRHVVQRAQVSGRFAFTPQGDNGYFGTISEMHVTRASIQVFRGRPCGRGFGGGGHGPYRCPSQPLLLNGMHDTHNAFVDFFGSTLRNGRRALIATNYQQWIGDWSIFHEMDAFVGIGAVHLGHHRAVTLTGVPLAFSTGRATFAPQGNPYHAGHRRKCLGHKSYTDLIWNGRLSSAPGDPLTTQFVTGAVRVPESPHGYDGYLDLVRITRR